MNKSLQNILALAVMMFPGVAFGQPKGTPPANIRPLSTLPNEAAMGTRLWVPDLDEGFVPQGMAFQGGRIILSGYVSKDSSQSRGPCRIYWVATQTGKAVRRLNLPSSCGHAGGLASLADGRLVVADTQALFVVSGATVSHVALKGKLRGSFADFDGKDLWIGSYDRSGGFLWRLPISILNTQAIDESAALETLPSPIGAQGLAFDRAGQMWMTSSNSRSGSIMRLDRGTGQVIERFEAPPGIEDIAFDNAGRLWASSEAGALKWSQWQSFFPLIFSIDVKKLR